MAVHWQPVGSDPLSEFASENAHGAVPSMQVAPTSASGMPRSSSCGPNDTVDAAVVFAIAVLTGAAGYALFLLTR